jgi:hypothetical protein
MVWVGFTFTEKTTVPLRVWESNGVTETVPVACPSEGLERNKRMIRENSALKLACLCFINIQ